MSTKTALDSPLANVASEIEERRCGLIGRHQELRSKVATMERSIPALMAYNMWMAERDCRDGPYDKVREIMNKFSPQPDPADRLLAELKGAVDDFHQETAQLHDKIIDADVKLEETGMELESLELANKEMEERLAELRNEIQRRSTPSLHSIHSEDLICLGRIRQFAEEELKLKNCIRELENKELMYRRQMGKLLSCKKFQQDNGKVTRESKEIGGKLFGPLEDNARNEYVTKKTFNLEDKKRKTCCSCARGPLIETCDKSRRRLPCCIPLDRCASRVTAAKSRDCVCCKSSFKSKKNPCSAIPARETPFSDVSKTGVPPKQLMQSSVPCVPSKTCNECTTPAACKQIKIYRCDEKRCDCKIRSLGDTYQSETLNSGSEIDSSSDEEFCECCSCGCEANDDLL